MSRRLRALAVCYDGKERELPTVLRRATYAAGKLDFAYGGDLTVARDETHGIALEVPLPEEVGDTFVYTLPSMTLAGRAIAAPPVRFTYRHFDSGVQPFNC